MNGKRHLGGSIGQDTFVQAYVTNKIAKWIVELDNLMKIAATQPHCAYAACRRSLTSRWTYLARTVPGIDDLFQPLEDALRQRFIPALTGGHCPGNTERKPLALPTRFGGLGLLDPTALPRDQYNASVCISGPLIALIVQQERNLGKTLAEQDKLRAKVKNERRQDQASQAQAELSTALQRCVDLASEKGAST